MPLASGFSTHLLFATRAAEVLREQIDVLKSEYSKVGDRLENEQNKLRGLQGDNESLKRKVSELDSRNSALAGNLQAKEREAANQMNEAEQRVEMVSCTIFDQFTGVTQQIPSTCIVSSSCSHPHFALSLQTMAELNKERSAREDATAAVIKLQSIIAIVREEMEEAQLAAEQVRPSNPGLQVVTYINQIELPVLISCCAPLAVADGAGE